MIPLTMADMLAVPLPCPLCSKILRREENLFGETEFNCRKKDTEASHSTISFFDSGENMYRPTGTPFDFTFTLLFSELKIDYHSDLREIHFHSFLPNSIMSTFDPIYKASHHILYLEDLVPTIQSIIDSGIFLFV